MNLAATHNTPATRTKVQPTMRVEFLDPKTGNIITRFVVVSNKMDLRSLNKLIVWAANHSVELRLHPAN